MVDQPVGEEAPEEQDSLHDQQCSHSDCEEIPCCPFHHTNIPVVSLYVPYYTYIQEFKFIMYFNVHGIQTYLSASG